MTYMVVMWITWIHGEPCCIMLVVSCEVSCYTSKQSLGWQGAESTFGVSTSCWCCSMSWVSQLCVQRWLAFSSAPYCSAWEWVMHLPSFEYMEFEEVLDLGIHHQQASNVQVPGVHVEQSDFDWKWPCHCFLLRNHANGKHWLMVDGMNSCVSFFDGSLHPKQENTYLDILPPSRVSYQSDPPRSGRSWCAFSCLLGRMHVDGPMDDWLGGGYNPQLQLHEETVVRIHELLWAAPDGRASGFHHGDCVQGWEWHGECPWTPATHL